MIVGYLRESKQHNDCLSQKTQIQSKFKEEPIVFFSDIISGFSEIKERTGYKLMLSFIENNNNIDIIVNSLDRLGRGKELLNSVIDNLLLKLNINKIISIREHLEITKDNRYFLKDYIDALGTIGYWEVHLLQIRLNEGRNAYIQNGGKLGRKVGYTKPKDEYAKEYSDAITLLNKGYTIRYVAKVVGVSPTTIQRIKNMFVSSV